MKRILYVISLAVLSCNLFAQQFQKQLEVVLPDSIQSAQGNWIDLDNDGLLDILLFSTAQNGKSYFQFIKGDTVSIPVLHPAKKTIITIKSYILVDYDHDNKIDVLLSGVRNSSPLTVVYINKGNFEFEEKQISTTAHSVMKFADLDNDARPEWIVSGENNGQYYFNILKRENDLQWKIVHDSLKIKATALEIVDPNGDGHFDMFISGEVGTDSLITTILINMNDLYFKPYLSSERVGITSAADVNADGVFDILLMASDKTNGLNTTVYESSPELYTVKNDPVILNEPTLFMADLNSDGRADVNYFGKETSNDTINLIRYALQDNDTLNSSKLLGQAFGDAEHDGDLDLIQVVRNSAIHIVFYENQPNQKNLGPGTPKNAIAVNVFDRVFLHWEKPGDDHTPTPSLTFDLHLNSSSDHQVGEFDIVNEKRLMTSHGNNGTENFRLFRRLSAANLSFAVQAVDNAFHSGSLCLGGFACANADTNELTACSREEITLKAPEGSLWFSFADGFLGISTDFTFQADKSDTIFYFSPAKGSCASLKSFILKIKNDTIKTEFAEKYACQDSEIVFSADPGWESVVWTSQLRGDLGETNTITYKVSQPDSVILTMSNDSSCTIIRKTAVKISKPALILNGDNFKILKGSDVQLSASGAQTYQWTPATGLNNTGIANPLASPTASIQYVVTGYDSLGCTDKASVNIIVEGAGFIPNLFTPNDDGKNDEVKVYGLTSVKDFTFTIHNREGSVVYKTSDVNDAVNRGWDGSKNGTKQPAGVYYWKVKGEVASGGRVLLNGKDTGSIVLVR